MRAVLRTWPRSAASAEGCSGVEVRGSSDADAGRCLWCGASAAGAVNAGAADMLASATALKGLCRLLVAGGGVAAGLLVVVVVVVVVSPGCACQLAS